MTTHKYTWENKIGNVLNLIWLERKGPFKHKVRSHGEVFTACNEVCRGYVFTRVCHSVHRGGGIPACTTGHMTKHYISNCTEWSVLSSWQDRIQVTSNAWWDRSLWYTPDAGTPRISTHPWTGTPCARHPPPPPSAGTPWPGPPGQAPPRQAPPLGRHSPQPTPPNYGQWADGMRSYWNAILVFLCFLPCVAIESVHTMWLRLCLNFTWFDVNYYHARMGFRTHLFTQLHRSHYPIAHCVNDPICYSAN